MRNSNDQFSLVNFKILLLSLKGKCCHIKLQRRGANTERVNWEVPPVPIDTVCSDSRGFAVKEARVTYWNRKRLVAINGEVCFCSAERRLSS